MATWAEIEVDESFDGGKGPQAKECTWPETGQGQKTDSPRETADEMHPCQHVSFNS